MDKRIVILSLLLIAGCDNPAKTPAYAPPVSQYDMAIVNLSTTTEQLEAVRKEKDLFVTTLEDFERQRIEYGHLWDADQIRKQMQYFADWHKDISIRERNLEVRHALNVLAAHKQVIKRKMADPNQASVVGFSSNKP